MQVISHVSTICLSGCFFFIMDLWTFFKNFRQSSVQTCLAMLQFVGSPIKDAPLRLSLCISLDTAIYLNFLPFSYYLLLLFLLDLDFTAALNNPNTFFENHLPTAYIRSGNWDQISCCCSSIFQSFWYLRVNRFLPGNKFMFGFFVGVKALAFSSITY
jgi:hypothetical protein